MTKATVCKHKATTDAAHFKQGRVDGTEVTNKFEIIKYHTHGLGRKIACEMIVALL